ncbi:MAG: segregation/condensation protein A [Tissierellia bacterium]|nr:segregation/condensation protein A [Tissierellia bacterium]
MAIDINQAYFSGPMDLLLQLIEKEEVDIADVKISKITENYLEQLEIMAREKEDMTDFIDMASTLIYIKSKSLLPQKEEEDGEEISEEILKQRIIEYQKMKELAKSLMIYGKEQESHYSKVPSDLGPFKRDQREIILEYDIEKLVSALDQLLASVEEVEEDRFEIIRADEFSVEEYVDEIEWMLRPGKNYGIMDFVKRDGSKFEIITIFLSLLELMKNKKIQVIQRDFNDDIRVEANHG